MENKLVEILDETVSSKKKPILIEEIKKVEMKYGFFFQNDYKEFLCKYGGSFIKDDYLFRPIELAPMTPEDGYDSMSYFYGDDIDDIDIKIADCLDVFGRNVVPIADAHGGDLICLGVQGRFSGQVFNWHHENEIDDVV